MNTNNHIICRYNYINIICTVNKILIVKLNILNVSMKESVYQIHSI